MSPTSTGLGPRACPRAGMGGASMPRRAEMVARIMSSMVTPTVSGRPRRQLPQERCGRGDGAPGASQDADPELAPKCGGSSCNDSRVGVWGGRGSRPSAAWDRIGYASHSRHTQH